RTGTTEGQLAARLGVTQQAVSKWTLGDALPNLFRGLLLMAWMEGRKRGPGLLVFPEALAVTEEQRRAVRILKHAMRAYRNEKEV
ncbi:MAG: hypothetical protein J6V72_03800, partial [Kiritimatiellae bacterium]|nr:hypothetical protein [Kiritimatiellia bacterium]